MYIDSIYIYISTRARGSGYCSAAAAAVVKEAPTLLVGRNKFKAAH